jgi:hypothetical protein
MKIIGMQKHLMREIRATLAIAVFLALIWAACPLLAQEGFSIKVDVSLVTTDVTVIGTSGSQLQPEDFIIYDNDVTQPVSYFSRDQIPLAVAIVIDRSLAVKFVPNDRCPGCQLLTCSGYYPGVSVPVPPRVPQRKRRSLSHRF